MAVSPSAALLPTEEYNDASLREAFVALSPAVIDAILSDVAKDGKAPSDDDLHRAYEDASVDPEVAKITYSKLLDNLNRAHRQHADAAPSLVALLHDRRGCDSTCAYSDATQTMPGFASVIHMDHAPTMLLSCHPLHSEEQYIATLWHHNVSVAVSLAQLNEVWPDNVQASRTFGAVRLTTLTSRTQSYEAWPTQRITVRTVRLLHDNGEQRTVSAWSVPWPDFEVLPAPALTEIAREMRGANAAVQDSAIAIHCFGGQGRSGTLALTIALQSQPRRPIALATALRALLQLRIQRQRTVETAPQFVSAIQGAVAAASSTADA